MRRVHKGQVHRTCQLTAGGAVGEGSAGLGYLEEERMVTG